MADNQIPSLEEHLSAVSRASMTDLAGAADARVDSGDAFDSMRRHVLSLYEGVQSLHRFEDDNGSIFDCIPVEQQPSLRGRQPATPVDMPHSPPAAANAEADAPSRDMVEVEAQLARGEVDRHGNERRCPEGCIPMRRLHLEELMRFGNIRRFLQKSPDGGQPPPHPRGHEAPRAPSSASEPPAAAAAIYHLYAHAYQNVANLGAHNFINVWQPSVTGNQIFSLSQHWYTNGDGSALQTAEVGWHVYPGRYGNNSPCLFIYWTADGYGSTGCYNLDCTAFVQTSPIWTFGGALAPVSTYNGAQYELEVGFYLNGGNWWLYLKGTDAAHAVGYYPTSIYGGGAMATSAADIDFGGETVGSTSFPPMGSGHFASEGFGKACYQRDVYYFPTSGGAVYASLTAAVPSPACYTAEEHNYAAPWNETIFYGGPGGRSC